jgi:hypothetical protein
MKNAVKIYPVFKDTGSSPTADAFVDASVLCPWPFLLPDGSSGLTSALKVNKAVDLIGISQSEDMLKSGLTRISDCIAPDIYIGSIVANLRTIDAFGVYIIDTSENPQRNFVAHPDSNDKIRHLKMRANHIVNLKGHLVEFAVLLSGQVKLDTGEFEVTPLGIELVGVTNSDGDGVSDATKANFEQLVKRIQILGVVPVFSLVDA